MRASRSSRRGLADARIRRATAHSSLRAKRSNPGNRFALRCGLDCFAYARNDGAYAARLALPGYRAKVDRAAVLRLTGFDWNCPQHIPQRFTLDELGDALAPLRARVAALEEENRALKRGLGET